VDTQGDFLLPMGIFRRTDIDCIAFSGAGNLLFVLPSVFCVCTDMMTRSQTPETRIMPVVFAWLIIGPKGKFIRLLRRK
jgi:hypothetical protein